MSPLRRHQNLQFATVTLFLLAGCGPQLAPTSPPRPVIAQRAETTAAGLDERYSGAIHARYEAALAFRIGGKVVERDVVLGQRVKAGQLLARLDTRDVKLSAEAAAATLKAAKARFTLTRRNLGRFRALRKQGFISQAQLDTQRDNFDLARAQLRKAQKASELAIDQLGYAALYAERPGVITAVNTEVGQVVAAGQPVFQLAGNDGKELQIDIPEGRIDAIRHTTAAKVTLWALGGRSYNGTIREIAAQADPATRTYRVKIALADAGPEVELGMSGTATLAMGDTRAMRLPLTSLFHDGDAPAVWVIGADDRVALRKVTVNRYLDSAVEIGAGLQPGEVVVTRGVHLLFAGERVRPITAEGQPL